VQTSRPHASILMVQQLIPGPRNTHTRPYYSNIALSSTQTMTASSGPSILSMVSTLLVITHFFVSSPSSLFTPTFHAQLLHPGFQTPGLGYTSKTSTETNMAAIQGPTIMRDGMCRRSLRTSSQSMPKGEII